MHYTQYDTRVATYALILDDQDRILLTWWNGEGRFTPGWSLPGGGVDLEEGLEESLVREVREEAGYDVVVGAPLTTHSWFRHDEPRPFKAVRVIFDATIVGGVLGTLEVGGSTDFAQWMPIADVAAQPSRAEIVDVAVSAHLARTGRGVEDR
ncbi:NUDIX domain-containing protein [Nocardioides dongxiaopingii]|uniref:NUDIX hydrolase n=1 Tax=Nocardioides TaxID=1839 RepID=UPI0010C77148|nr:MULTISPECIES: NUDIX domain-containing protein [Nocardioides]QCW49446.1 NUDIX domain-containing protein [Nocardioides sp. S-1144]